MILKIDLGQTYNMDSKLILGNKYKRVEGNLYEAGFAAVTIATGSKGNDVYSTNYIDSSDGRIFYDYQPSGAIGQPDRFTHSHWGLRIYYETVRCEVAHSTSDPVMETNTSDFYADITINKVKTRVTHTPEPIPNTSWVRPSAPWQAIGSADMYTSAANSLLGRAAMTVVSADYYNAVVDVSVIVRVEIWNNLQTTTSSSIGSLNPFGGSNKGTVNLSGYSFNVFNNTFFTDSNPYELGEAEKKYTYKYADNLLISEHSTFTNADGSVIQLIEKLYNNIIINYQNGKQIVHLSVSEGDYKLIDDTISTNHLFEVGQYVQLYNGTTPLIYYKLSNIVKIFEIVECEYIQEQWNLVLKEVANGTN